MAHHIIYCGKDYPMSIAEITADGKKVSIEPFVRETASTVFINGTVKIIEEEGVYVVRDLEPCCISTE